MQVVSPSTTAFWMYWAVGLYALFAFLVVIYHFETADERPRSARMLEAATILMAGGAGLVGAYRLGLYGSGVVLDVAGPLLLASQLLVLKVVYDAYGRVRGSAR